LQHETKRTMGLTRKKCTVRRQQARPRWSHDPPPLPSPCSISITSGGCSAAVPPPPSSFAGSLPAAGVPERTRAPTHGAHVRSTQASRSWPPARPSARRP
jgi:hypothetical protein